MIDWNEAVKAHYIFREFVKVKTMLKAVDKFHLLNKNFMRPHEQYRHINPILKRYGIVIDYWYTTHKWYDIYGGHGVITFQFFRGIPNQIRSINQLNIDIDAPPSDEKLEELLTHIGFKEWPGQ